MRTRGNGSRCGGFGHFQQRITLIAHGVTLFAQRVTLVQKFTGPTHVVKIDIQFVIWTANFFFFIKI